jgi:hypothetical protein
MTKDEALKQALEALDSLQRMASTFADELHDKHPDVIQARVAVTAIKQALAAHVQNEHQPVQEPVAWMFEFPDKRVRPKFDSAPHGGNWQPLYTNLPTTSMQQPDAYGYARRLADAIWKKHYKSTAPQWEPFDNLIGVLTQIDNMTSGLTTPPAAQRQWVGLTQQDIDIAFDDTQEGGGFDDFARAIEAKLKEKNT